MINNDTNNRKIYIYENDFLKLSQGNLKNVEEVLTSGVVTCIFVVIKYRDESYGFAHIDGYTHNTAIEQFTKNAADVKIVYAAHQECMPNKNNIVPLRKWTALGLSLGTRVNNVQTFNIESVLACLDENVDIKMECVQRERISCHYNIRDNEITNKVDNSDVNHFKHAEKTIKHRSSYYGEYCKQYEDVLESDENFRCLQPRVFTLNNNNNKLIKHSDGVKDYGAVYRVFNGNHQKQRPQLCVGASLQLSSVIPSQSNISVQQKPTENKSIVANPQKDKSKSNTESCKCIIF